MAFNTNSDKMLAAVLMCPDLMKFGHYDTGIYHPYTKRLIQTIMWSALSHGL